MATAKRLPSGNWRVRIYDTAHKQYKSFTASTKREAESMALIWLNKKELENRLTVGKCIDSYIDNKEHILLPTSIDSYRRIRHNFLAPLCNTPIDELTQEDVQRHMNILAMTKAPKTVHAAYGLLASVLNVYAPKLHFYITLPKIQKKIKQLPDIQTILRVIIGTEIELPCMLALWEGMRMSEIRGARKSDIHDGVLTIHQTTVTVAGKHITKDGTKTIESTRRLELPEYILNLIDRLPEEQNELTLLTGQAIYKRFSRLLEKHGVAHITL